jgi:hypothetical protein
MASTPAPPAPSAAAPGRAVSGPPARRLLLAVALAALVLGLVPTTAEAHPFGPPPRSWLEVEDTTVLLSWEAAYDDYLALGEQLGYFEPGTSAAYLDPSVQVAPPRSDEEALATSDDLRAYLAANLVVEQDGQRCDVDLIHTERFVERGAILRHQCPQPVEELTLRITMLQEINEAYRTFGLSEEGPPGPFAVFTVEQPEHPVDVSDLADDGGGGGRLVLVGALAVLGVGVPIAFRRLTRPDGA